MEVSSLGYLSLTREDRDLFELLTIIKTNPTMNSTVNVGLSSRPLTAKSAGPTIREKPAIAVSLPRVLTKIPMSIAYHE
jgi:hypothetical protein